jgi:hypothetical protein
MKVIHGQKNIFSLFYPLVSMGGMAFRATSISARMEEHVSITASFAFIDMAAEFACATFFYVIKCPDMAGQHAVAKAFKISGTVMAKYFT